MTKPNVFHVQQRYDTEGKSLDMVLAYVYNELADDYRLKGCWAWENKTRELRSLVGLHVSLFNEARAYLYGEGE